MKRLLIWIAGVAVIFTLNSCATSEIVRVDLTHFNENPEEFEDKRVIIKTDIEAITKNPEPYLSKDIELSGFVKKGSFGFDWGFLLEDEEGLSVKCYERKYRLSPWVRADMAVRKARIKNEKITIVGEIRKNFGIELDWIEYEGEVIDTDYKPYRGHYRFLW
jgi:hypothetical protein